MNVEDSKRIFLEILPEEEFIDRRIETQNMIDPESESDDDNIKFVDDYDKSGRKINQPGKSANKTVTDFQTEKSYTSGFYPTKARVTVDGFTE